MLGYWLGEGRGGWVEVGVRQIGGGYGGGGVWLWGQGGLDG